MKKSVLGIDRSQIVNNRLAPDLCPRGNVTLVARRQGLVVLPAWLPSLKGGHKPVKAGVIACRGEDMNWYSAAISAKKVTIDCNSKAVEVPVKAYFISAMNEEEAFGILLKEAREKYPYHEGYENHNVHLFKVDIEPIINEYKKTA